MRAALISIVLAGATALAVVGCGDDDEPGKPAAGKATPAPTTTAATPAPAKGRCERVAAPKPKGEQNLDAPEDELDPKKTYVVVMDTSCGEIQITLDVKRAPDTAASVASLVRKRFYDGLTFHRIGRGGGGEDFVIQGGDPLGNGQGGPGYSVTEEPPDGIRYTRGVVAMAKTQLEDPGTSGSQFYIVTAKDAGLPAEYALLGRVTAGDDVVSRIAKVETDPQTEQPLRPVVIRRATLRVQ